MSLSRAQKLALAATLAAQLRAASRSRRVKLFNQHTGEVTREMTLVEAQQGILRTLSIEIDVGDGVRPEVIACRACGRPVPVGRGPIPKVCLNGCRDTCASPGCENTVSRSGARRAALRGAPALCRSCGCRTREHPPQTPAQRAKQAASLRARLATLSADERQAKVAAALEARRAPSVPAVYPNMPASPDNTGNEDP